MRNTLSRLRSSSPVIGFVATALTVSAARADLESYVKAPDDSYGWSVEKTADLPGIGSALTVRLTSQTWKGIPWRHWLSVIRPPLLLHKKAHHAQAHRPWHQRPLLARGCGEALLRQPGGRKVHSLRPQQGHGLGPGAIEAVSAFYNAVITKQPMPRFTWSFKRSAGEARMAMKAQDRPERAELWHASAPTRDFRDARWEPLPAEKDGDGSLVGKLSVPQKGFAALFGRLTFQSAPGQEYALCTNIEVLGDERKASPTGAPPPE